MKKTEASRTILKKTVTPRFKDCGLKTSCIRIFEFKSFANLLVKHIYVKVF